MLRMGPFVLAVSARPCARLLSFLVELAVPWAHGFGRPAQGWFPAGETPGRPRPPSSRTKTRAGGPGAGRPSRLQGGMRRTRDVDSGSKEGGRAGRRPMAAASSGEAPKGHARRKEAREDAATGPGAWPAARLRGRRGRREQEIGAGGAVSMPPFPFIPWSSVSRDGWPRHSAHEHREEPGLYRPRPCRCPPLRPAGLSRGCAGRVGREDSGSFPGTDGGDAHVYHRLAPHGQTVVARETEAGWRPRRRIGLFRPC